MKTSEFILDTLAHYVRGDDGPPPGVSHHLESGFETQLAAVCVEQDISPIIVRSLDALALPPEISKLTVARLRQHANALDANAMRLARLTGNVVERLEKANLSALVIGDVARHAILDAVGLARPVKHIELLIHAAETQRVLDVCEKLGFILGSKHPLLDGSDGDDAAQLENYHHYIAPLILVNGQGDKLWLRYRVIDAGHVETGERAWERSGDLEVGDHVCQTISAEDHLIEALTSFGIAGLVPLTHVIDAGVILRNADGLDWGYIKARTRIDGCYTAFVAALRRASIWLCIPRVMAHIDKPLPMGTLFLESWWPDASQDFCGPVQRAGRFRYGLLACGGPISKLKWLTRYVRLRRSWIETAFSRRATPWLWLKFLLITRIDRFDERVRIPVEDSETISIENWRRPS